jgi:hypothetical protein
MELLPAPYNVDPRLGTFCSAAEFELSNSEETNARIHCLTRGQSIGLAVRGLLRPSLHMNPTLILDCAAGCRSWVHLLCCAHRSCCSCTRMSSIRASLAYQCPHSLANLSCVFTLFLPAQYFPSTHHHQFLVGRIHAQPFSRRAVSSDRNHDGHALGCRRKSLCWSGMQCSRYDNSLSFIEFATKMGVLTVCSRNSIRCHQANWRSWCSIDFHCTTLHPCAFPHSLLSHHRRSLH